MLPLRLNEHIHKFPPNHIRCNPAGLGGVVNYRMEKLVTELKKVGSFYRCPYGCGDKRYPAPKWKTVKGAQNHIEQCPMRPSKVAERKRIDEKNKTELDKRNSLALQNAKHSIGDVIAYIVRTVRKPTHVRRGNRMVKVRYEPEYSFSAHIRQVESVSAYKGIVFYNGYISEGDIRKSIQAAEAEAQKKQQQHLEANEEASRLR